MKQFFTLVALCAVLSLNSMGMAADAPLTFQDIGKLRLQRNTNDQILELAKKRGVAFEIDKAGQARLRSMRFKPEQIAIFGKIADGSWADEAKRIEAEKAAFEASKPKAMKPGTAPSGVQIGPRMSDAWHNAVTARAKRIQEEAKTSTALYPQRTVTVICSKKAAKEHLPNVKKIEELLKKQFPEPIATGTDKRSAIIVLLDDRYEYEKWVKAMFKIYEQDGMRWTGQDPLAMALKGPAFLTGNMTVADLSAMQEQNRKHHPVFSVGYHYMNHLTERKAPDGLVNGFGNVAEEMVFGQPIIRVNAYAEREIGGTATSWASVVKELLKKGELPSIGRVLNYSMQSMEPQEYCAAWSMTKMMAMEKEAFTRWLVAIRDMKKEEEAKQFIQGTYQKSVDELNKIWEKAIGK